jgi:hypothetical protein
MGSTNFKHIHERLFNGSLDLKLVALKEAFLDVNGLAIYLPKPLRK